MPKVTTGSGIACIRTDFRKRAQRLTVLRAALNRFYINYTKKCCEGLRKDYKPPAALANTKDKELVGTVMEVYNGDAVLVKVGTVSKKVFFSSIRPPRPKEDDGPRAKNSRPLYDIPYMFEAREFLRKKLIGKRVTCTLDYVAPARDNYPEKYCYTVRLDDQ